MELGNECSQQKGTEILSKYQACKVWKPKRTLNKMTANSEILVWKLYSPRQKGICENSNVNRTSTNNWQVTLSEC